MGELEKNSKISFHEIKEENGGVNEVHPQGMRMKIGRKKKNKGKRTKGETHHCLHLVYK